MFVLDILNALIDWMNAHGSNDYASITFILFIGAIIWDKLLAPAYAILMVMIHDVVSNWKERYQQKHRKESR